MYSDVTSHVREQGQAELAGVQLYSDVTSHVREQGQAELAGVQLYLTLGPPVQYSNDTIMVVLGHSQTISATVCVLQEIDPTEMFIRNSTGQTTVVVYK